ncbi:MAG: hypothetical protein HZC40_02375 [Chloroflexi bacterium]|nr:hypothetical protein [Chloroflexota bacterium]
MTKIVEIKQGIWIDEQILRSVGVGERCQVLVRPGEIRILPLAIEAESLRSDALESDTTRAAWQVFRALGQSAPSGKLPNTSTSHDLYLYGRKP